MRKLLTGELCAGEPHAQFGGRGGRELFPTPINNTLQVTFDPLRTFAVAKAHIASNALGRGRYKFL